MLIKRAATTIEKLDALGGMARDDILSRPEPSPKSSKGPRQPYTLQARNSLPGVYRAALPNGKFINLMRVMFTDFCKYDCHYCPNSTWVPRKRYGFKVDELANAFMELHQRHTVAGLFLSSGIAGSSSLTMERMVKVVEVIRKKHKFNGYIHLKVMPGADYHLVEAAASLGSRLSINIESPTPEMLSRISPMKDMQRDILDPMSWIHKLISGGHGGAIGQATQMVVGAANETDWDIFQRMEQLYSQWNFKRVYYSPFQPVRYTPLEEHPVTPMVREHRLYQVDWLKRVYRYSNDELKLAYDDGGFLPHEDDPKTSIALQNLDTFPVNVNEATKDQLLRVPGLGPTSAQRILQNRKAHSVDTWRSLQAMGVVKKRAWPFLYFPGHRPPRAKQLKLDLFGEAAREQRKAGLPPTQTPETCGVATSCAGCPMYGMPGHPGA
ncbi:MAG: helix-hairpin-helix domain-containing protein [Chloroflexi bacterium]|nr:helix-hairpin-helix domain-containing protein [Chloroflexota bacterium]